MTEAASREKELHGACYRLADASHDRELSWTECLDQLANDFPDFSEAQRKAAFFGAYHATR